MIEAINVKIGTVHRSETYHFTGGLVAQAQQAGGWVLGPVDATAEDGLIFYQMTWPEIVETTQAAGCALVGVNQHYDGSPVRREVWRPVVPFSDQQMHASDSWGAISHQAGIANDPRLSDKARYLSVSVHAAGARLRDVARAHHEQLGWALQAMQAPDKRFANLAMTDLYLAFHALASELCSARDHLGHIAAMACGAKDSVDSLAHLEQWVLKPVNASHASQPLVALLLSHMGTPDAPGWLRVLGTVRNTMVHRQPMGADPASGALRLTEVQTRKGPLRTLRLVPMKASLPEGPDPFGELVTLYNRFEMLAIAASRLVPHKAELPLVTAK